MTAEMTMEVIQKTKDWNVMVFEISKDTTYRCISKNLNIVEKFISSL